MAAPDWQAAFDRINELTPAELTQLRADISASFDAADAAEDLDAMDALVAQMDQVMAVLRKAAPAPVKAEPETPAAEVPVPAPPAAPPVAPEVAPPVPAPVDDDSAKISTDETPSAAVDVAPVESPVAEAAPVVEAPVAETAPVTPLPATSTTTTNPVSQEGIPVAAAATTAVAVPEGAEPVVASAVTSQVFAGADIPGYTAGHEFTSAEDFSNALARRLQTLSALRGGDGEQVVIASIRTPAPADRTLTMGDARANMDKIEAVTSPDAFIQGNEITGITAAGGCCAPLVTRYNLWENGGVTDRPVRDALAGFRADRGGIRFFAGPALADIQGAMGFWTCADDSAADPDNTATWKVCARINCPPEQTAELQAITMCLTFGVMQTRIFPEVAAANNKLALVAQARLADSALLAQIKAGSIAITDAGTAWGAVRDLMNCIGRASMYMRDRYRIRSAPLRAIMPSWVLECLRTDLLDGPDWGRDWGTHYGVSEDEIRTFFSNRNINVTFALDSSAPATEGGGFFPAISGGVLPTFPTSVQWCMFPEGSWLFLDGGQLDLGIVRDSRLVRTNDYMQFSETFEAAAKIGGESLWITSAITVNGAYPAAV